MRALGLGDGQTRGEEGAPTSEDAANRVGCHYLLLTESHIGLLLGQGETYQMSKHRTDQMRCTSACSVGTTLNSALTLDMRRVNVAVAR